MCKAKRSEWDAEEDTSCNRVQTDAGGDADGDNIGEWVRMGRVSE